MLGVGVGSLYARIYYDEIWASMKEVDLPTTQGAVDGNVACKVWQCKSIVAKDREGALWGDPGVSICQIE